MTGPNKPVVVIGGGPAGLTFAYELQKLNHSAAPLIFEGNDIVGGIARTENHKGYRFDIGGHRFFTKVKQVEEVWKEVLSTEFITVPRLSRIFYQDKFYDYPLKPMNALRNIGLLEACKIVASLFQYKVMPHKQEDTFEQWVQNRFGDRLYRHFFKSYTEKVWGVPCTEIRADWAAQRIKNLSLTKAVWNAFTGSNDTASLIEEFQYPRLGPGQMWETMAGIIEQQGGTLQVNSWVKRVIRDGTTVVKVEVETLDRESGKSTTHEHDGSEFANTMPLRDLINCIEPAPPKHVLDAANMLKYRDFMIVTLVLDHDDPFPDNWIYVHSDAVKVGRIQNFRAWSEDMVPRPDRSSIGMEYFLNDSDDLWSMSDEDLINLASSELEEIGLAPKASVIDGAIIRQPKAYPVYDSEYKDALATIKDWLSTLTNFQTIGRNGLHRYNNQDHSMLSAILAARNLEGQKHDVWEVNVERSYHEEFQTKPFRKQGDIQSEGPEKT